MIGFSLDDQIKCVEREIAKRERWLPKWAEAELTKKGTADRELACMRAVLATLMAIKTS